MDAKFAAILESLPPKVPRSRLEPYRELIREMRRRGRTYREIAQVLGDRCQVQIAASTVHEFVSRRSRVKPVAAILPEVADATADLLLSQSVATEVPGPTRSGNTVSERIRELKQQRPVPETSKSGKPVFAYDENEPLRVRSITSKQSE